MCLYIHSTDRIIREFVVHIIMNIIHKTNIQTDNWDNVKTNTYDLFNMDRSASEKDVVSRCSIIWNYDMDLFVALMFYMRGIRKNPTVMGLPDVDTQSVSNDFKAIPKGRGEKLLSYWMALWLLNTDVDVFARNFTRFVRDIGYFKDCLIMAKMALKLKYDDTKIMMILMPLAIALVEDEDNILKAHMKRHSREKLILSRASKWAPRQGKTYSSLIPYMKKLCGITGSTSDAKWRKYIQSIVRATTTDTVELLMSTKNYDKINFNAVPNKAFNLYKKAFVKTPVLTDRFAEFIQMGGSGVNVGAIHPHEILTKYLSGYVFEFHDVQKYEDAVTEAQWKCYIDDAKHSSLKRRRNDSTFIPMIDVSGSLFDNNALPIKAALTLGLTLSQINTGLFKHKAITFNTDPLMMDIKGDTAIAQISSIFGGVQNSTDSESSTFSTNFVKVLECLLEFYLENNIPPDQVAKINVVVLSDMEFNQADSALCMSTNTLQSVREKFSNHHYQAPQIIYWNLRGHMSQAPCVFDDSGIAILNGFNPIIIETFLETGVFDPTAIPFQILETYKKFVCKKK
jgi:hypothetical protein